MIDQVWQKIDRSAHRAVHRIHVRSALNPVLWLCAITTPICLFAAYQFRTFPDLCSWLIIAGVVPIAVACLGFAGFAIFNPGRLQSEDYQLRHETLQIIQQKVGRITLDPASLDAIANPKQNLLEKGGTGS